MVITCENIRFINIFRQPYTNLSFSNEITGAPHSRTQIQENPKQSAHINVPNNPPINNVKTIDDVLPNIFKYYEKTYPEKFIHFLRLKCTLASCDLCTVSFHGYFLTIMKHYNGKKHSLSLKKHFVKFKFEESKKIQENPKTSNNIIVPNTPVNNADNSQLSTLSSSSGTPGLIAPPTMGNRNTIYNGITSPSNPPIDNVKNIHNLLDMFKYYEKIYPQKFIIYLKLRCTNDRCILCEVSKPNMTHYKGKRHVQTLKDHFELRSWQSNLFNVPKTPLKNPINVPKPQPWPKPSINNVKDIRYLSDMFIYYEKLYPEMFMDYLKLKCTNFRCKLCGVSSPNMLHYKGQGHAQSLKKHYELRYWRPINMPNTPINDVKDIKTLSDMFKYYRKTYPEEFIQYLKLRFTRQKCNLCRVDFTAYNVTLTDVQMWNEMIIDHCKEMKHSD